MKDEIGHEKDDLDMRGMWKGHGYIPRDRKYVQLEDGMIKHRRLRSICTSSTLHGALIFNCVQLCNVCSDVTFTSSARLHRPLVHYFGFLTAVQCNCILTFERLSQRTTSNRIRDVLIHDQRCLQIAPVDVFWHL